MKEIIKNTKPKSLTEHKAKQHSSYENLPGKAKDETRESLLKEQGYICCYCMTRIPESGDILGSKIEHYLCQTNHPSEDLNYGNMLLACLGSKGSPSHLETCDTKKGKLSLTFTPASTTRNIEDLIEYRADGEIFSSDETFNTELKTVLNLNVRQLKENRRIIFEEIRNRIKIEGKRLGNNALKKKFLEKEKNKLLSLSSGKYSPFCMVGVYVIDKKLKRIVE